MRQGKRRAAVEEIITILARLSASGLSLQESFAVARTQARPGPTLDAMLRVERSLRGGSSLSQSMVREGPGLPPLVLGLLELCEASGAPGPILAQAEAYLAKRSRFRHSLVAACVYPAMVLLSMVGAMLCISAVVLPNFLAFARNMGGKAGEDITALSGRVDTVLHVVVFFLALVAALGAAASVLRKASAAFRLRFDRAALAVPVMGDWIRDKALHELCYALSVLTRAGQSIHKALGKASSLVGNRAFAEACETARVSLVKGQRLSQAFASSRAFPPFVLQWLALGEAGGRPEDVFGPLEKHFSESIERRSKTLSAVIDPLISLVTGLFIVLFVLGFIVPVFSVYGNLM